jgi:tetrapyrrole methylase family protein/MazG family protein
MQELNNFQATINAIRDPKTGCVWNLAQDHHSLKRYLLEELYETLDSIDALKPEAKSYEELKEELGDLFLQIILHSKLAEEKGYFNFSDVVKQIDDKMIRRHPHVFKRETTGSVDKVSDVDQHWDKEKAKEKQARKSIFEGIPRELPALARAWLISKKAVKESFEWDQEYKLFDQLDSELKELAEVVEASRAAGKDPNKDSFATKEMQEEAELELGDILFTVVNIARWYKLDPEDCLRKTNNKFINRFDVMMDFCKADNKSMRDYTIAELEELWQKAKVVVNTK